MDAVINGTRVAYETMGRGKPVVLVHGFPLSRRMWDVQAKALAATGFLAVTVDLPGFGGSELPTGVPSISTYADAVVGVLDALDIGSAAIGGMSMGGYVLLDLLKRHPERCSAALFLMTRSGADDAAGKERRTRLAQEVVEGNLHVLADAFIPVLFSERALRERQLLVEEVRESIVSADPRGMAAALCAMRDREDYTPLLPQIAVPSLVVAGENDRAMSAEQAEILRSGLREPVFRVIAAAGHAANLEKPEEFNRCLISFLSGTGKARGGKE